MILYSFSITRLFRLSESFERREWYPGHSGVVHDPQFLGYKVFQRKVALRRSE